MWTAEFTEAVDALTQDASISDDTLHARAHQCLDLLTNEPSSAQLSGPPWAKRIQNVIPKVPVFSTLRLFQALYTTADRLGLVSGKRYVSATICACCDCIAPGAVALQGQWTNLVQALDDISSTWAVFVLWPFYAHGADDDLNPAPSCQCHWTFWRDSAPRTDPERMAELQRVRDQQRCWKKQVIARDNYYCFMCGRYDTDWFFRQEPKPKGANFNDCNVVPIIKREVLTQDEHPPEGIMYMGTCESHGADPNITRGILKHYFGMDAETLLEKAQGPQNTLFVNNSACDGYRRFRWCLHPTKVCPVHPAPHGPRARSPLSTHRHAETHRYKIVRYGLRNFTGSHHVKSHVTIVDHSQSPSQAQAAGNTPPVDLPDPALLRVHAALAGVLWRSGAVTAFDCLFNRPHWLPGYPHPPAPRAAAFWTSVAEYEGEETCLEVDLDLAMEALRDDMRARAAADPHAVTSRNVSPSRD